MLFSIILPVYNAESTLRRTLNSIYHQTYSDFEVLMIDDGSSDFSEDICKEFAKQDLRFRYFKRNNCGVSATRNYGIKHAKGEFITFIDSDDLYKENYLEDFANLISRYPNEDNYWSGFRVIYGNHSEINIFSEKQKVSILNKCRIMDAHEKWMDSTLWNKVFRKSIVNKYKIFMDEKLCLGEDLLFNFDYLNFTSGNIVILNKPLYIYMRSNTGTLDSSYRSDMLDIYGIIDKRVLEYLAKWNVSGAQLEKYYSSIFYSQEKIMRNTFRKECGLSRREKYKFNNAIMRSEKFKKALYNSDCHIHILYRMAYGSKHYIIVRLIDELVYLKGKRRRHK